MNVCIGCSRSKVATLMALPNNLPYVKTKPLTPYKAKVLEDVKEAVDELNMVFSGMLKARNADDLLNEL